MGYSIIQIDHLMAYEFGQVEGDFLSLCESDLKSVIPARMLFQVFQEQLINGYQALLTDMPSLPLLIRDKDDTGNRYWRVNPDAEANLAPLARKAYTARVELVNHELSSPVSGSTLNASASIESYIDREAVRLTLKERLQKQRFENHMLNEQAWEMLLKQ
ncbi:hypothetical protein [Vibrio mangrovi]|uniref:Uncharacterized protein n=1 Tax=Vibrio mangrovi TaxID=474394 RepID=A0A1Y6IVR6_9VIBR|nr:hypothetical protein [Vibrio mangrovi]MDW6001830.1 hypothetical protein [Vibrio mangrovi]SMS00143.1 hypothetical protein VIM7927_01384 [Vibrio mangrovi]